MEFASLIRTLSGATSPNGVPPTAVEVPTPPSDAGSVTLIVNGAKDAGDEDVIFETLQAALPGDVDVQFEKTRTGLKVTVGPVGELSLFAKQLTFGTITKTDPEERILHIDMKP